MTGYLAQPRGDPAGGVLVLHAWWGLNGFFKSLCNRLAFEGFLAAAPDLYGEAIAATIPEAERLRTKIRRDAIGATILAALADLQADPDLTDKPLGLIGFSMGAHWGLWLLEQRPEAIAAAVLFYGARGGEYAGVLAAFLGHFAEADSYVAASGVKKLEAALKKAGRRVEVFTYPGTRHWFFESDRPEYDPAAADLAWERTTKFLHEYLG